MDRRRFLGALGLGAVFAPLATRLPWPKPTPALLPAHVVEDVKVFDHALSTAEVEAEFKRIAATRLSPRWWEAAEQQAPRIIGPRVTNITARSADVWWETDVPAKTAGWLGTANAWPRQHALESQLLSRRHFVHLTGLEPNTAYTVGTQSEAANGWMHEEVVYFSTPPAYEPKALLDEHPVRIWPLGEA